MRRSEGPQGKRVADATPAPKGGVLLVGGSRLTDVLYYTDRIVLPYAPKTMLLNAGGNDLSAGKTPE